LLGRNRHDHDISVPFIRHETVIGQLFLYKIRVGVRSVDFIKRDNDGNPGGARVCDGFPRLGHDAVIGCHYQDDNIGENDIMLASASKAFIVGFNVTAEPAARRLADTEGVSIRLYNIIYRLTEDVEKALKGMLEPEFIEVIIGKAEVLSVFKISKVGNIAGCRVLQNELKRNGKIRVMRNNEKIFEGDIASLKHEKDDVREVRQGFECGVALKGFNDFAQGDILECFTLEANQ
jgi:translation initiation factor IF-2